MPIATNIETYSSRGVALLEVVISLMLLSIVVIGLIQVEQRLHVNLEHGQYKLKAANHIENYFESLRTRGANSDTSQAAVIDFDSDIKTQTVLYPDGVTLEAEVLALLVEGNLKRVKATGSWQLSGGDIGSVSATTMVARHSEFD